MVTWQVGDVDYQVVQSDRGGVTQVYHLNLFKAWRDPETTSMVSLVEERDELGPEVPNSTIPASLHCDNHLTQAERVDVAALQKGFANVFSHLPGRTSTGVQAFTTLQVTEHKR